MSDTVRKAGAGLTSPGLPGLVKPALRARGVEDTEAVGAGSGLPGGGEVGALLNKVPQVALLFWLVKMMSTTVGETGADLLAGTLGWGTPVTTVVIGVLLVVALVAQFRARSYVPVRYWSVVVLVSVAGMLASDMLVDLAGVPLGVNTAAFAALLTAVFIVWWWQERTLSIHTINTRHRETFYWLAILATFAPGTSGGDLLGEALGLGTIAVSLVFAAAITVGVAWFTWRERMGLRARVAV